MNPNLRGHDKKHHGMEIKKSEKPMKRKNKEKTYRDKTPFLQSFMFVELNLTDLTDIVASKKFN
jgi:hypothetical protein